MDILYIKNSSIGMLTVWLLLTLLSCRSKEKTEERTKYVVPDSLMNTLRVDTVKMGNLSYGIKFNGIVDFNTDKVANLFPLISGNVQNITVMPGDFVKAGQVLGMIKSPEIANYNASLINAETNVRLTKKQLDQQKSFFSSGLSSQVDVTNAEVNYQQAQAAKIAAEKVLLINGDNKNGEYFIKSPTNGFIVQKYVTNGMAIRIDNGISMFTISDLKNVWIQANVYEANIGKVHVGDPVEVTTISYPDKIFKGKVNNLMNVLDPTTKVMKMRVVLDNPDYALKPQMFATISIINDEKKQAITIASSALIYDNSQYYVIILKGRKDVQIRPVEVISINGTKAYIKSGVLPGEYLLASDALLIYGSLNS